MIVSLTNLENWRDRCEGPVDHSSHPIYIQRVGDVVNLEIWGRGVLGETGKGRQALPCC